MISRSEIKFLIIQVILTLLIAFIPIYFYIDSSVENQKIKDKLMLKDYANLVILKMKEFESENSDFFTYPRSNIFTSAIFNKNDEVLFSLFNENSNLIFDTSFFETRDKTYYKQYLQKNRFGANYIIVSKTKTILK